MSNGSRPPISMDMLQKQNAALYNFVQERLNKVKVNEINSDMWPMMFPFEFQNGDGEIDNVVVPGGSLISAMTVSADAAFVVTKLVGSSYMSLDPEAQPYEYINQQNPQGAQNANGLVWQLKDLNSTRVFSDGITPYDTLGGGMFPYIMQMPLMIWPSSRLEMKLSNTRTDTATFLVKTTALGYRIVIPEELLRV